jgi:diaminohydroxyphosphoribosylaminopyrimidine deaminase/5-amino-6-(5-phosphoribosylamino)uracil reductase
MSDDDIRFMGRAVDLALARMGTTWPNPARLRAALLRDE